MEAWNNSTMGQSIWAGLESYSDATSLARNSAQLQRVQQRGLTPSIAVAARLLRALEDPDFSVREVAAVIESDPGLTVKVLGLANSPMFARPVPCRDVRHAVSLLGARTMGELAAVAAASELWGRAGVESALRGHAVSTACVARELAEMIGRSTSDVFLAALLRDLGKLVLLQGAGDERYGIEGHAYAKMLERRGRKAGGTHLAEQAALGFDHAAMGRAALQGWNIPEPIPSVVGWHHDLDRARQEGGRVAELVSLLRLADALSHAFEGPRLDERAVVSMLREPAAMAALGLTPDQLASMIPQLEYAHASTSGLLD